MRMDSDVWAGRWAVEGEGGGGDDGTFDVYHRPNLERARKGRLPLVYILSNIETVEVFQEKVL